MTTQTLAGFLADCLDADEALARAATLPLRFRSKFVIDATGCWLWAGPPTSEGYAQYWSDGRATPHLL